MPSRFIYISFILLSIILCPLALPQIPQASTLHDQLNKDVSTPDDKAKDKKNTCPKLRSIRHLLTAPIKRQEPKTPDEAKRRAISGKVEVLVHINEDGKVYEASACNGHPLLRKAAIESALKAEFLPVVYKGKHVKGLSLLTYIFSDNE